MRAVGLLLLVLVVSGGVPAIFAYVPSHTATGAAMAGAGAAAIIASQQSSSEHGNFTAYLDRECGVDAECRAERTELRERNGWIAVTILVGILSVVGVLVWRMFRS